MSGDSRHRFDAHHDTAPRVTLILDAAALRALDRNDRAMWRRLKAAVQAGEIPVAHGA